MSAKRASEAHRCASHGAARRSLRYLERLVLGVLAIVIGFVVPRIVAGDHPVPVTTLIATLMFRGDRLPIAPGELDRAHTH